MHWSGRLTSRVGIPIIVSNLEAIIVLEVELVEFYDRCGTVVSTKQVHSRGIPRVLMQKSWSLFVFPISSTISILVVPLNLVPWRGVRIVRLIVNLQHLLVVIHYERHIVIGLLVSTGNIMVDGRIGLEPWLVGRCGSDLLDRDELVNVTSGRIQFHNDGY